jgi:hypothetical protein
MDSERVYKNLLLPLVMEREISAHTIRSRGIPIKNRVMQRV